MASPSSAFLQGAPLPLRHRPTASRRGARRPPSAHLAPDAPDAGDADERARLERSLRAEMAPTAGGKAECACIWCAGAKVRRCSWCGGRGVRKEFVNRSWDELAEDIKKMQEGAPAPKEAPKVDVVCSACAGKKEMRCAYCRGSGLGSYGHAY